MGKEPRSVFKGDVSKARLEFLFDGVFAIAMTILVLELKLPELQDRRSVHELGTALLHHGRTFFSYIISFIVLSSFWISHNRIYTHVKMISKTVLVIHVWLLAAAAFIPFCAHLMGRYPSNPLAILVYVGTVYSYVLGMLALVITAERQKLFDPAILPEDVKKLRRGFIRPLIGMFFIVIYVLFILPVLK